mmetsp:Transcript_10629/g.30071  ORF Transcript_10629/g.30071 Transcript_10629/m.30071 type:complete len:308 (-) Transcript_10629:504-1427(-)
MYMGKQKTPTSVLDRKVPRNPRYAAVKGSLDTGSSVSKVKSISTKEFLKRQNEIFARIKARELSERLELADFSVREEDEDLASHSNELSPRRNGPIGDVEDEHSADWDRADRERKRDASKNLLLLDVRDAHEFEECNIKSAIHFPLVNVNQDRLTTTMLRFKNHPGKLLVVYDEDERIAAVAARSFVEKGFENIRLLTGGLRTFGNVLPHLLNGVLPERLAKRESLSPTGSTATRREERRRRREGDLSPRDSTYASSVSASSIVSSVSHRSTFSRAPRWKDDRSAAQRHKELLARLHHASNSEAQGM